MVTQLIAIFIFSIFLAIDLNGVIGQMYVSVIGVFQLIIEAASSDIALIVPVAFDSSILNS